MALFTSAPPLWTYPPFQLRKYSQTFSRTLQLKRLGLGTIRIRWQKNSYSSNILVCYSPLANDPAVSPDMRECAPDIVSQLTILRVPPSLWIENWAVNCIWSILHENLCWNGLFYIQLPDIVNKSQFSGFQLQQIIRLTNFPSSSVNWEPTPHKLKDSHF